ncbi:MULTISPECIES: YihD family protein [unclassified Agarivorans]|uniref:YihD family protein n=1 Tax=unclassified Agarivorans TaxID=2636026 RepID=UPI003D7D9D05
MQLHRIEELIDLLKPVWRQQPELNLVEMLTQIADQAGFKQPLSELTDDVLIYQLKMLNLAKDEMIPGLAKDCEDDFKTALLKARGIKA